MNAALPKGELSTQLTERAGDLLKSDSINPFKAFRSISFKTKGNAAPLVVTNCIISLGKASGTVLPGPVQASTFPPFLAKEKPGTA